MITPHVALAALHGSLHPTLPRDLADIASRADITEIEAETALGVLLRAGLASRRERGYTLNRAMHLRISEIRPGDMYVANSIVWKIAGVSVDGLHATLDLVDIRDRSRSARENSTTTRMVYRAG